MVIYSYVLEEGRRLLVQDAAFLDYYVYEEENSAQTWTMVPDSTKDILGYTCQKALCSYRGRDYEVWFSHELAVNAGPWKFSGLPGLIMEAQDTKGHYTFHMIGIEKKEEPIEYVEYTRYKFTKADRKTVLRAQAKAANIGWNRYMKASTNQNAINNKQAQPMPNNKSRYNLLERDY